MIKEKRGKNLIEAKPFLRYGAEKRSPGIISSESDSAASSGGDSASGSGAGECAHVPLMRKSRP